MKRVKRIIASLLIATGVALPAFVPVVVSAAPDVNGNLCNGANLSFSGDGACDEADQTAAAGQVDSIIETIINIISIVVAVISVIMIIIGGLRYITSNGESSNVTNAKNTILYAIVGLVVVALAQLIVKFVVGKLSASTSAN